MELFRALSEKKCLLEGRTSVLTTLSTYEADTSNSSNAEPNTAPSAVVQTETNGAINEGPVEENVTVPVAIPNQGTQTVTVSAGVAKDEQTLESTLAQQVATNVPAAEQLAVELLDRNQQTQQDLIKTVTITPGDVKEGPIVDNTVQVVPITTVTTRPQTEELEDVHHDSYDENATLLPAAPPSAVVHTEANQSIKEGGPVEENVTVPVAIPNQETQIVPVSADVAKEGQTLESTVVQQVTTNVPAAEQLAVELLDRNQQTPQDPITTVTITSAEDSKIGDEEANRLIKDGAVKENVTVSVVIPNQETQIVPVSADVAKEEQTLESTVAQQVATNVSEPTANIERTNRESNTLPSAVVQTETIRAINEGSVEENVTVPVQTQTVTVSAAVATEEQSSSIPATTQVSEPTANIETTNIRRSSRVSRKRHLSVSSNPEPQPQAKKNTRRSAPPAQPTANIEPTNIRRSGRLSRKRSLSGFSNPEPQAKKNTRRSAPPAQPTAATRSATVGPSRAGPWICAECGQGFTGSGVLATHVRTHTGEKPYRCNWTGCDFSAGDRSNVARHVRGVHLKLPVTKKEQRELGIVQQRHERDYIIKVQQQQH